jgi:hypothetical protein
MKLSIKDRLSFSSLYPRESNLITQLLVKSINEKIVLTQEETKEINLKIEGEQLKWDNEKTKDKEVEFNEAELNFLKQQITKLDGENKITQGILETCLKIQEEKK